MPQEQAIAPTTSSTREQLHFSNLDEVLQRVEQLHRDGYRSLGKWNLAQVCEHLSDWMEYMINGYPAAPLPIRWMLWSMRVTVGKSMLGKILASGKMAKGGPTMKQTVHAPQGLDEEVSLRRFKETVERFQACDGVYHASPIFGPLSAKDGMRLQLVHCAHHLSFLSPVQPTQ